MFTTVTAVETPPKDRIFPASCSEGTKTPKSGRIATAATVRQTPAAT